MELRNDEITLITVSLGSRVLSYTFLFELITQLQLSNTNLFYLSSTAVHCNLSAEINKYFDQKQMTH